jgi:hypothetical protein
MRTTYSCVRSAVLPAGKYRVAVNVYDSNDAAALDQPGHLKVVDFALPVMGDVLTVSLGTPDNFCESAPGANAEPCGPSASREVACNNTQLVEWRWEGGLGARYDSSRLDPPADYTRTRTFTLVNPPSNASCMASVPRCSYDARVVTTSDVVAAFNDPDVVAALAKPGMLVYGTDARAYDGSILLVTRTPPAEANTGGSFGIGPTCVPNANTGLCARAVPDGLVKLQQVLTRLDTQMEATPACAALPTAP